MFRSRFCFLFLCALSFPLKASSLDWILFVLQKRPVFGYFALTTASFYSSLPRQAPPLVSVRGVKRLAAVQNSEPSVV